MTSVRPGEPGQDDAIEAAARTMYVQPLDELTEDDRWCAYAVETGISAAGLGVAIRLLGQSVARPLAAEVSHDGYGEDPFGGRGV